MEPRYNVVFVGKTGTGKSALINYLYGDNVMKTGTGKPVTQQGFYPIDCEIKGLPARLFDSWGLEVGKDQEWIASLNEELKNRDTGKPVKDWFHTVFYCIGGGGHRVEPFDVQIIRRFIDEKYKVAVILTKADAISKNQAEEMKNSIIEGAGQPIPVIPVCSVEDERLDGTPINKFGKDKVELQAYNDFWDSIILRLPDRCEKVVLEYIDRVLFSDWKYGKLERMENFSESLKQEDNPISNLVINEVRNSIETYGNFAKALNYPPNSMEHIKNIKFNLEIPKIRSFASEMIGNLGSIVLSGLGIALTALSGNPLPSLMVGGIGTKRFISLKKSDKIDLNKIDTAIEGFKRTIKKEIKPSIEQLLKEIRNEKAA